MGTGKMVMIFKQRVLTGFMLFLSSQAWSQPLVVPNNFTSGSLAIAAEVNENFNQIAIIVNDNDDRVTTLVKAIATLNSQILKLALQNKLMSSRLLTIESNSVLALNGKLISITDSNGYDSAQFIGVNVQIINGVSQTAINGLGNLTVGYNVLSPGSQSPVCSHYNFLTRESCESNGEVWSLNHRSGSHNLIVGSGNAYSRTGGVIFGTANVVNNENAVISGGENNTATAQNSSISGGTNNKTIGITSSINGGKDNIAASTYSNISGGSRNKTAHEYSSISGGQDNETKGPYDSILGGKNQTTTSSSISSPLYQTIPALP